MAVGGHDTFVLTYDVNNKFSTKHKLRGNSATITHIDFSLDGNFLMTIANSYEILFYNT